MVLVVECAIVLVRVATAATKDILASAFHAREPNLPVAGEATLAVLLDLARWLDALLFRADFRGLSGSHGWGCDCR